MCGMQCIAHIYLWLVRSCREKVSRSHASEVAASVCSVYFHFFPQQSTCPLVEFVETFRPNACFTCLFETDAGLRRRRVRVQIAVTTLSGNSLRQTVHTHCTSVHWAAKLVAALSRVAGVTAGLAESNGSLPPGLWLTSPAGWLPRTGISSGTLHSVIVGNFFHMLAYKRLFSVIRSCQEPQSYHIWQTAFRYVRLTATATSQQSVCWTVTLTRLLSSDLLSVNAFHRQRPLWYIFWTLVTSSESCQKKIKIVYPVWQQCMLDSHNYNKIQIQIRQ